MNRRKIALNSLLAVFGISCSIACNAAEDVGQSCTVGGNVGFWVNVLCEEVTGTKSQTDNALSKCKDEEIKRIGHDYSSRDCVAKQDLKKRMCEVMSDSGKTETSEACFIADHYREGAPLSTLEPIMPFRRGDCSPLVMSVELMVDLNYNVINVKGADEKSEALLSRRNVADAFKKWKVRPPYVNGEPVVGTVKDALIFENDRNPKCK